MPKKELRESVLQDWVHELSFQMQALLLTGIRGPDENNKHNIAKSICRYLRGVVIKPAGNWNYTNNNDWCWGDYTKFEAYVNTLLEDHDYFPHHFLMHLIHCAEVVAYMHPDKKLATSWFNFYERFVHQFHMNIETKKEMILRLNNFGVGIHNDC